MRRTVTKSCLKRMLMAAAWSVAVGPNIGFCWWNEEHQIIAEIAVNRLSDDELIVLNNILVHHPRFKEDFFKTRPSTLVDEREKILWNFKQAAVWPDIAKTYDDSLNQRYNRPTWHYVNFPVFLSKHDETEVDSDSDKLALLKDENTHTSFNILHALEKNLGESLSANVSNNDRALALCWIVHLVGDLHQPMHTVTLYDDVIFPTGDRGGNDTTISVNGQSTNLHSLWDGLLLSTRTLQELIQDTSLDVSYIDDRDDVVDFSAWAKEHYWIADNLIYSREIRMALENDLSNGLVAAASVSSDYVSISEYVARKKILIAGTRLSRILSEIAQFQTRLNADIMDGQAKTARP